jgi:hypothetical protein
MITQDSIFISENRIMGDKAPAFSFVKLKPKTVRGIPLYYVINIESSFQCSTRR